VPWLISSSNCFTIFGPSNTPCRARARPRVLVRKLFETPSSSYAIGGTGSHLAAAGEIEALMLQ